VSTDSYINQKIVDCQPTADLGSFPLTKKFGKFLLGISLWEERVPFATSSIRGSRGMPGCLKDCKRCGTGDNNNKDEKSVNGTQIFHWEVSTGKTGLPSKQFHFFWEFSSHANQKNVFHLAPNWNHQNF